MQGFMFGNLDENNQLDADYLDAVRSLPSANTQIGLHRKDQTLTLPMVNASAMQETRQQLQALGSERLGLDQSLQVCSALSSPSLIFKQGSEEHRNGFDQEKLFSLQDTILSECRNR